MRFDVHVYAIVRVKLAGVEAKDSLEAIQNAESRLHLFNSFTSKVGTYPETEFTESLDGYLVDELGSDGVVRSDWFDAAPC